MAMSFLFQMFGLMTSSRLLGFSGDFNDTNVGNTQVVAGEVKDLLKIAAWMISALCLWNSSKEEVATAPRTREPIALHRSPVKSGEEKILLVRVVRGRISLG
jgi:hypothetical protein